MSHAEIEAIIAKNRQPAIAPAKETRSLPPSTPTEIVTTPDAIGDSAGGIATVKPQVVEGGTAFAQTRDEFITGSEDPRNLKRYGYKLAMDRAREDGENAYPAWLAPAMAISYGAYQGTMLPHRLLSSGLDMAGVKYGTDWQKYYAQQDKYHAEQTKEAGGGIGVEFLGGLSRAAFEMPLTLLTAEAAAATKTMQLMSRVTAGGAVNLNSTVARKAVTDASVTGSAAMSGIQSAAGKYAERRESGAGRFEAGVSGATSGLITGFVTKAFGATGLEAIYEKGGKKGLVEAIKNARRAGKYESAEELTDEGIQDFVDRLTFDPNRPISQTLKQMAMAYFIGGTLGSGMSLTHSGMAANEEKKARQAARDEHDASVDLKIADFKKSAKSPEELLALAEIEIAVRKQRANRDALPDPSVNIETGTAVTPVPTEAISPESPLPVAPSVPLAVETTPLPDPLMESPAAKTGAVVNRNTDLFPDKTDFMGKLSHEATLSNYQAREGFGVAEYANPTSGVTDVYLAAFGDNDFIAYIRVYDKKGNPTNRFTSKLERRSNVPGVTRAMLSDLQSRLPAKHEYTEDVSVSTDGLKFIASQLRQGYEVATDQAGRPLTQEVAISGESLVNDLPIAVDPNGKFDNIRITNRKDFDKVRPILGGMLEKFGVGLGEKNVRWENGTAFIDIPVLRKAAPSTPTAETGAKGRQIFHITSKESAERLMAGEPIEASEQTPAWASSSKEVSDAMLKSLQRMNEFKSAEEVDSWFIKQGFTKSEVDEISSVYGNKKNPAAHYIQMSELFRGTQRFGELLHSDMSKKLIGKEVVQVPMSYVGNNDFSWFSSEFGDPFTRENKSPEAGVPIRSAKDISIAKPTPTAETGANELPPAPSGIEIPRVNTTPDATQAPRVVGDMIYGKPTKVKGANDIWLEAVYAWAPLASLEASHKGESFAENKIYAGALEAKVKNTKDYKAPEQQIKVHRGQNGFVAEEYVAFSPSAAVGPMMVSEGTDGVRRVLGGNGRYQIIARLSLDQQAEFGRLQDEYASMFSLPPRPTDGHVLVRVLPAHSVNSVEGIAATNFTIDILNPSDGLVEDAVAMAVNDSAKVSAEDLSRVRVDGSAKEHRAWISELIGKNVLDRNTRTAVMKTDAGLKLYAQYMIVTAAYQQPAIADLHATTSSATTRGTIELAVPMLVAMRGKGEHGIADGFSALIQRIGEVAESDPSLNFRSVLETVYGQEEINAPPEFKLAQGLAGVLSLEIEESTSKSGATSLNSVATLRKFKQVFSDFEATVNHFDPAPDMFGEKQTMALVAAKFIHVRLGDGTLREGGNNKSPGDPKVLRLRKLRQEQSKRTLTQREADEIILIEAALGQSFMFLFNEVEDRQAKANEQSKRLAEAQALTKDTIGDLTLQGETLFPQQGTLFASDKGRSKGTNEFPGFDTGPTKDIPNEPGPTKKIIGPAQQQRDRAVQLGWFSEPQEPERSRGGIAGNAKQLVKARAEYAPEEKPRDRLEELAPELKKILRPHQVDEVNLALEAFANGRNFGLFSGTGAGKTVTELTTAYLMSRQTGKPSIIVTAGDGIIGDAFARDAEMLGIDLFRYKGSALAAGQNVLIATYNDVSSGSIVAGQFATVIFDESHHLRNQGQSLRPHIGNLFAASAEHVMFASGTPLDRPQGLWYLRSLLSESPEKALLRIGIETKQRWDSDGNPITFFESIEGVGQKEIESGLESLFDGVYKAGLGIKHEVPLDNLDVVLTRVELTPEEYKSVQDVMGAAELKYEDAPSYVRAGLIMMAGRSALEAQKGRHAMESVEKALAEGKQVIIYAHRIEGGGWGLPNGLAAMEAKMRAKYGDAVGSIYGGASTAASAAKTQKTVDGFQNGKIKILFSTPQSGGTGISLDDIRGDAPRHLILVTSPFSALDLIQIAGRINRLNTASRATMEILLANHRVDNWNLGISLSKLGTLQATVKGDIGEMVLNEGTKKPSTKTDYEQLELNALFAIEHLGLGQEYNNLGSAREIAKEIQGTQPVPTAEKVGPARMVEKRIAREMLTNGFVRIDGQIVKNVRDIGVLLNLWRSPQFEVSAIHAIKNGVIVGSRVITANLPNTTSILLPGEDIGTVVQWLNSLGADTTVFSHNHPSGNSSPSDQDIQTTKSFAVHLNKNWNGRFWGHVVTDHGRFHVIDGDGASRASNPSFGGRPRFHQTEVSASPDPLISKAGKLTQQKITGFFDQLDAGMIQKVGNQVKGVQEGETIALMFLDQSESIIRAVYEVSVGDFPSLTPEHLREIARGQGASIVVAVMTKLDAQKSRILGPQIVNLIRSGALYDFVADKTEMRSIAIPMQNDDLSETKDWMGISHRSSLLLSAGKPKSKPIIIFSNVEGRKSEMPYNLGGLDHVRVVDMPELVKLAKRFLGHLPKIKKLGGPAGVFRHKGNNFTIEIDPRVFRDPVAAAKVLAHEFGHLTDYLPDLTLDRGNILGRLGGLRGWLATTIPLRNTGSLNSLTPTDRKILRRQAEQDAGPQPAPGAALTAWQHEVSRRFAELKKKEIKARGLVERDEVAAELRNLTMLWHPYDEATSSDSYKKYRNSSVELYADFLSALFNSPGFAADTAPLAYKMFWDYLDSKPEMKVALFSLQDFLSSGRLPVLEQRSADIQEMFGKGEDIMARKAAEREARRTSTKGWLLTVKQEIIDVAAPVIRKMQQAEKAGKKTDPTVDPRRFIEEQLMMDNVNARMLDLLHRGVMQPIEAADITMGLLGEYVLFQRILHGDRGNIADPLGHDVKSAREGLLRIRLELGPDRMDVMLRAVAKFHEIVWGVVEEGVRVGSYNRETFDTVLVPNKGYYVAFGVLDYLQDYVPAGVKKQTGTFKEIANPFTQTVLKMIALNNLNSVQRTKNSFVDFMAANFSTEMMPAETYFDGANHRPVTHPDWGIFERLENGKRKWYYVDPLIADAFENDPPVRLQQVLRVLETGFQKVFYPLWITYNTAFQIANIKRDWSRTRRNTGLGFMELGKYYLKGFSAAVARQRAIGNPIITEMTENYAIGPADINFTDLEAREDFIGKKMQRYGLLPEAVDSKLKSKLLAGVDWVRFIGNVIETMPKVAAYAALRARGVSPIEVSMTIRNFVGTPNTYKRGKRTYLIRPFIPFFNVFAQGFRADASLAFSPKTAGGWWWRWASTDGLWAVMTALAAAGLLGDELKKWLAAISENDKTNYNLIPVGVESGGDYGYRTVYIRVPRDESSRLLSAMLYKTVRLSTDGKVRGLSDIAAVGLDQLPAINPVIEIAGMVALAAAGHHVREFPSGRPIMSRDEFDAGGMHKVEAMAVWTYNQTGLQDLARLTDLKGKEGWNATLQFVPGIHRFIKVSDQGHREAQWEADRAEGKVRALHKMAYSPEVLSLYSEYYLLRDLGVKGRTQAQGARYDVVKGWHKNVFSVHDEAIHQFKDIGDNGTADNIRNILRENSKLYLKK